MRRAMPRLQHASLALQAGATRRPLRGMLWEPHLPQGSLLPSRYHAGRQVTSALHAVPRKPLQGRLQVSLLQAAESPDLPEACCHTMFCTLMLLEHSGRWSFGTCSIRGNAWDTTMSDYLLGILCGSTL